MSSGLATLMQLLLNPLLLTTSSDLIRPPLSLQQGTYIVRLDGAAQNF